MAQTSEKTPVKHRRAPDHIDDEIEDVPSNSLMSRLTRVLEHGASTAIGQYAIRKMDNVLWTVEKTAKWSLPQYTRHHHGTGTSSEGKESQEKIHEPPLTRPLPWIFFIPMLIALRVIRTGVSVGALMLRKGPVTPAEMVHFIQSRRRNLRAIKYTGLRSIRMRHIKAAEERRNGRIARRGVVSRLSNVLNLFICGSYGETTRPVKVVVKNRKEKSTGNERKKRHVDESDEEELGCNDLLDRLANEDDSNDSSFADDTLLSSDITISDDESETDNILNKTMNEKDTPKFATPKYRKSRSNPNSGASAEASEPTNVDGLQLMSTPKRSQSHSVVTDTNGPLVENKMKNGENGHSTIEETKKSPLKNAHIHMNGSINNRAPNHRPNRQSIEYYKNVANEMVIHEDEQFYNHVNGSAKESEASENPESINNLPESQRSEAPPKTAINQPINNNSITEPKIAPTVTARNTERSHGGRGKQHKQRRNNSQNNRRNGGNVN